MLIDLYRKRFDYLDYIDADNLISPDELASAYTEFDWPKESGESSSDVDYAKKIVDKFDIEKKGGLAFVDFVRFQEDMWEISDKNSENKCSSGFDKSMEVWDGLFKWLDRDSDSVLKIEDLIYGISKIMYIDANKEEISKVFEIYAAKDGKLTYESFVLAIANGLLDKSLGGL